MIYEDSDENEDTTPCDDFETLLKQQIEEENDEQYKVFTCLSTTSSYSSDECSISSSNIFNDDDEGDQEPRLHSKSNSFNSQQVLEEERPLKIEIIY